MNPRPLGYEPSELPNCSTPRRCYHSMNSRHPRQIGHVTRARNAAAAPAAARPARLCSAAPEEAASRRLDSGGPRSRAQRRSHPHHVTHRPRRGRRPGQDASVARCLQRQHHPRRDAQQRNPRALRPEQHRTPSGLLDRGDHLLDSLRRSSGNRCGGLAAYAAHHLAQRIGGRRIHEHHACVRADGRTKPAYRRRRLTIRRRGAHAVETHPAQELRQTR